METHETKSASRRIVGLGVAVLAAVALSASAGMAQPSSPPSSTAAPPGPAPPPSPTPPELVAPPAKLPGSVPQSGTASGVIRPPGGVDPGIQTKVPAPNPNSMPVIPPPGAPGGNPNVQPK
jgi:hypothetical protein